VYRKKSLENKKIPRESKSPQRIKKSPENQKIPREPLNRRKCLISKGLQEKIPRE